ncbi:hypothetical protein N9L68_02025 [bacterium]|nr:hypothetical protein [bacterium]
MNPPSDDEEALSRLAKCAKQSGCIFLAFGGTSNTLRVSQVRRNMKLLEVQDGRRICWVMRKPCDPRKAEDLAEPKGFGWGIEGERGSEQGGAYERWLSTSFDVADPDWDAALECFCLSSRLKKNEVCVYCFWDRDMSEQPMICRWCNGLL